jgi:hypothetical protein
MKQSLFGRTSLRWVVKCLLVLLLAVPVAGLAHTPQNIPGPKIAPSGGSCGSGCQHVVWIHFENGHFGTQV